MKIAHIADIQVKNRDRNLYLSYFNNLKEIVKITNEQKFDSLVIAGDLFEFATPNESERRLIYNFVVDLVKINSLKEIVIISGNHDLEKYKKRQQKQDAFESDTTNNLPVLGVFTEMIKNINEQFDNKIIYMKESKVYDSKIPYVKYIGYSLEDGCTPDLSDIDTDKYQYVCVYHGMIKEYVDSEKLPIKNSVYENLDSLNIFPRNSIIMAGDIHQNLVYDGLNSQMFYYSGSTQQHTHNEGNFYKFEKDVVMSKLGEMKKINVFDFSNKESCHLSEIILKDYVKYFTFEFTNECEKNHITENIQNIMSLLEDNNDFGETQNYFKIKSLTKFIKDEHQFFDLINKYNKNNNFNVSFEYEKISTNDTNIVKNETVKEVIKSVTEENETDIEDITLSKDNIDKLILKNNDIKKLFEDVLNSQLDNVKLEDFTKDTIKEDVLDLFSKELDNRNSEKHYDVVFKNIKCNNFMGLGENEIDLDIPGIVRILGTNGIGKTTLFKMIRWCISGEILENMKSNTVVKNNLLVFNKNLPEIDDVEVIMNVDVKNTPVRIIRTLHRNWKNNTTYEQKHSKDWKDYVSGVDRNIKIIIKPDTESSKTLIGENAELNISLWFGETINNIMFLNQTKIEQFIRSEPEKLNKMVLNYIGVDYIQKLEDNLENVKENLMSEVSKPKYSKEDIQIKITDCEVLSKKCNDELNELKSKDLISLNENINLYETEIKRLNDSLINIGNVPLIIEEKEKRVKDLSDEIDNFEFFDIKQKKIFNKEEPKLSKDKVHLIDTINEKIQYLNNLEKTQKEENQKNLQLLESNKEELINQTDLFKINVENLLLKEKQKSNNLEKILEDCYRSVKNKINSLYKEKQSEKESLLSSKSSYITTLNSKIDEIKNNEETIKNGVCHTCKRPFSDDYENHKKELLDKNNSLKQETEDIISKINENDSEIRRLDIVMESLYINDDYDFRLISNIAEQNKIDVLEERKTYEYNDKILEEQKQNYEKISRLLENVKMFYKILLEDAIKIDNIDKFISDEDKTLNKTIKNCLMHRKELLSNNKTYEEFVSKNKESINKLQEHINKINNDLNESIKLYNKELIETNKENEIIETQNKIAEEHNKKKDLLLNERSNVLTELETEKNKLPIYEKHKNDLNEISCKQEELKISLKSLNDELTLKSVALNGYKIELQKQKQLYDDLIKYQKNQIIWKIYNKLIKGGFRDIVFEYYRCFLNNTLNNLLEDVNFKLYWDSNNQLYMIDASNGVISYQPVINSSGMETSFLGLTLIYTIHLLNVKNSISHIFIDELSGTLSKGDNLTYEAKNYQDLFIKILNKFNEKTIFIVDHNIDNLFETLTYEVYRNIGEKSSKFRTI